jgi:hypothetical protein
MLAIIRTNETFDCHMCGRRYQGTKEPMPFVRSGRFDCIECNAEIQAWSGFYDYTRWKYVQ